MIWGLLFYHLLFTVLGLELRDLHKTDKCSTMEPPSQPFVMGPWIKDMMMISMDKVVRTTPLDASDVENCGALFLAHY